MKKHFYPAGSILFLGLLLFSCQKDSLDKKSSVLNDQSLAGKSGDASKSNTFYGPQVQLGNGKVRTFTRINHAGNPEEIGVEITEGALSGLPTEGDHHDLANPLTLHQKAKDVTPFDHVSFDWNPNGHPPFFFSVPHFDVHFYMISMAERMEIPEYSPSSAPLFDNLPTADYIPANYAAGPGGEPMMGKHWSPPPPSFLPFSKVMIWGSYNGRFTFIEPMVTYDYLMSGISFSSAFGQPLKFPEAGNYPTVYNIYTDSKTHNRYISLSNFTWHNAN
jgi:hypothetical protein